MTKMSLDEKKITNRKTLLRMKMKKYLILLPSFVLVIITFGLFFIIPYIVDSNDVNGLMYVYYILNTFAFMFLSIFGLYYYFKISNRISKFERYRTL